MENKIFLSFSFWTFNKKNPKNGIVLNLNKFTYRIVGDDSNILDGIKIKLNLMVKENAQNAKEEATEVRNTSHLVAISSGDYLKLAVTKPVRVIVFNLYSYSFNFIKNENLMKFWKE